MARPVALSTPLIFMALAALALLILIRVPSTQAETYSQVTLYLHDEEPGSLDLTSPGQGDFREIIMDTNVSGPGQYSPVGTWVSASLKIDTNLSGSWSFSLWANSDQDVDLDLRVTLRKDGDDVTSLVGEASLSAGSDKEVTASGDMDPTAWGTTPIEIYIESRWDRPVDAQPDWQNPSSLTMRYDGPSYKSNVAVSLTLLTISLDPQDIQHDSANEKVNLFALVETPFGPEPLSDQVGDYSMSIAWEEGEGGALTKGAGSSTNGRRPRFEWSYGGLALPAGDNTYTATINVVDALNSDSWQETFDFNLYIEPVPKLNLTAPSQERTVNPGKLAKYTLVLANPGTGLAQVNVTTSGTLEDWTVSLSRTSFSIGVGDRVNVQLSIGAPSDAQDEDVDLTTVTATTSGDTLIVRSLEFTTTVVVPPPVYGLSLKVDQEAPTSWDLASVEYLLTLTNTGNRPDSFSLVVTDKPLDLSFSFSPPRVSDLDPGLSQTLSLTVTPKETLGQFATRWPVETPFTVTATSSQDSNQDKDLFLTLVSQFSGQLLLDEAQAELEVPQGQGSQGRFTIQNLHPTDPVSLYFEAEPADGSSYLARGWVTFYDDSGELIQADSPLTLQAEQTATITFKVKVSSKAKPDQEYQLEIKSFNSQGRLISPVTTLSVTALEAQEDQTEMPLMLVGLVAAVAVGAGGALFYLKPWAHDDEEEGDLPPLAQVESVTTPSLPGELPSTLEPGEALATTWAPEPPAPEAPPAPPAEVAAPAEATPLATALPGQPASAPEVQPLPGAASATSLAPAAPAAPVVAPAPAAPVAAPTAALPAAPAMPAAPPAAAPVAAAAEAQPVAVAAEPVATAQPQAVAAVPQPVAAMPPQPMAAVAAAAEPVGVAAQPIAVEAAPVVVEAQPQPVAAQPVVAVAAQPVVVVAEEQ